MPISLTVCRPQGVQKMASAGLQASPKGGAYVRSGWSCVCPKTKEFPQTRKETPSGLPTRKMGR
jgi:hypothetical protein